MKKKSYIVSDPDIHGGIPVIAGTRMPISQILFMLKTGHTLQKIHEMFPYISIKTLEKVIDEIDQKLPALTNDQTYSQV